MVFRTSRTRAELVAWTEREAVSVTDGRILLDHLIEPMRTERITIPGVSVTECMAAMATHAADIRHRRLKSCQEPGKPTL
ncbi:hypothetical protein GCM10007880_67620 [Mesorhizobium amorphae]|uniref:hypothetical protein n=1 Tax=Mesorhizobium amorphae TaxID=71433 RepID=UPI00235C5D81|nr:hypothetical protein [Mesorhizobium amorphae]GLR46244.1 hypothetical protein GCM10007880_67620 [Mesorhizobium amorphae]